MSLRLKSKVLVKDLDLLGTVVAIRSVEKLTFGSVITVVDYKVKFNDSHRFTWVVADELEIIGGRSKYESENK